MNNPQGPDRHPEDAAERTGEIPAWGTPPPGGWGADPETTGAWSPERDDRDGWATHGSTDAGWDPATARRDATHDAGGAPVQGTGGWDAVPPAGGRHSGDTGGWAAHDGSAAGGDTGDRTRAEPLWGDEAGTGTDTGTDGGWAVPTGRRARRRAAGAPTDAVPASSPESPWADAQSTAAVPADGGADAGGWQNPGPGEDEPWVSRDAVRSPSRTRLWILAGIGAVVVAALVVGALFWAGVLGSDRLDRTTLQAGVTQVLTRDYGLQVGAIACPEDVEVSAGTRFTCQAVVDGEQVEVPVVVTSDQGDYQVGRV
ncbi:DUF4333 domain-containing protein [Pseudonocardia sp. ICBG601]|uniref:DUF4333 domain-containing protein n=1 Tax=Pseudonocardia sp. ICBG601 TaxID=2846759 RepID=UPI001CF6827E|nr:DUF4333 domain-containing protein [Pseudonocardia sp. ICBG601]